MHGIYLCSFSKHHTKHMLNYVIGPNHAFLKATTRVGKCDEVIKYITFFHLLLINGERMST